jgi:hypothetical protein
MRLGLVSAAVLLLGGCSPQYFFNSFTPSGADTGPFGTTSISGALPEAFAAFNNTDPSAAAIKADQICTLGKEMGQEQTMPADPTGDIHEVAMHCVRYTLSLVPVLQPRATVAASREGAPSQ